MSKDNRTIDLGFFIIIFIIFLILKLTKVIDWSWWWITSPLWVGTIVFLILVMYFYTMKSRYDQKIKSDN